MEAPSGTRWSEDSACKEVRVAVCLVILGVALALVAGGCSEDPTRPEGGVIVIDPEPDFLRARWLLTRPDSSRSIGWGDTRLVQQPPGDYFLEWGDMPGWSAPPGTTVTLVDGGPEVVLSCTYLEGLGSGTVVVDTEPDSLGAEWTLWLPDGGRLAGRGDSTLVDMPGGEYEVTWDYLSGWSVPPREVQWLRRDSLVTFLGNYASMVDEIVVDIEPDVVDAPWTLTIPGRPMVHGRGDTIITDLPVGVTGYRITHLPAQGWVTPLGTSSNDDGSLVFSATYDQVEPVEFLAVPPVGVAVPVTFTMGSGEEGDATPHEVTLTRRFGMSATEVTLAQYVDALQWALEEGLVTDDGNGPRDAAMGPEVRLIDRDYRMGFSGGYYYIDSNRSPRLPMQRTTWSGALAYCNWVNQRDGLTGDAMYRLPTEAEWELACRAGTTTRYSTGDVLTGEQANYGGSYVAEVGTFAPNPWGLYDMHGNMGEWCQDWYGPYPDVPVTDPTGPATGTHIVLRGGYFGGGLAAARSAARAGLGPQLLADWTGFRIVRTSP